MMKYIATIPMIVILISCDTEIPISKGDDSSSEVSSAPIYLDCEISTTEASDMGKGFDETAGSTKNSFSVSLNQISRDITHTNHGITPSGFAEFTTKGQFSATTISYELNYKIGGIFKSQELYEIDRSSLSVNMVLTASSQLAYIKRGSCEIVKVQNKI